MLLPKLSKKVKPKKPLAITWTSKPSTAATKKDDSYYAKLEAAIARKRRFSAETLRIMASRCQARYVSDDMPFGSLSYLNPNLSGEIDTRSLAPSGLSFSRANECAYLLT